MVAATADVTGQVGDQPMTQDEFGRAIAGGIRSLPGSYETSRAVLAAMQQDVLYDRPDDHVATLAAR